MDKYQALTPASIKALMPCAKDQWLPDSKDGARGAGRLWLRVSKHGVKRFYFRHSRGGKRLTIPLGIYSHRSGPGVITLNQARERARELALSVVHGTPSLRGRQNIYAHGTGAASGADHTAAAPVMPELTSSMTGELAAGGLTLKELCEAYIRCLKLEGRTVNQLESCVRCHLAPSSCASKRARDVRSEEITELLRPLINAGKRTTAGKLRSIISAAYRRAMNAKLDASAAESVIDNSIERNPVAIIPKVKGANKARERVLSDHEQRACWRNFQNVDHEPYGLYARVLRFNIFLGGQRLAQLLRVKSTQVDLKNKTILLFDGKGRREVERAHLLPLTQGAVLDAKWLVERSERLCSEFLFPSNVDGTLINHASISNLVTSISKQMLSEGKSASRFQFSDWRRTIETTLASLGVHKDHRAQLQSHGLSGVQDRHYDMWEYMPEKRKALEILQQHLDGLLEPVAETQLTDTRES
jgi:integrase